MDERRKDPRAALKVEAEVTFASWDVFRLIYTVNISKGGMRLQLPKSPELNSTLTVKFALPSGEKVELQARVRNVRPMARAGAGAEVGVEFENLDAAKKAQIEKLLNSHTIRFK